MAKLVIKLNEQGRKRQKESGGSFVPTWRDLETSIDGREIESMTSLTVNFAPDSFPEAKISFFVDDIDVDTEALIALQAVYEKKQEEVKG